MDKNIEYLRVIVGKEKVKIEITIEDIVYKYIVNLDDSTDELLERLRKRLISGKCGFTVFSKEHADRFGPKGAIGETGSCGTCHHCGSCSIVEEETDKHKNPYNYSTGRNNKWKLKQASVKEVKETTILGG